MPLPPKLQEKKQLIRTLRREIKQLEKTYFLVSYEEKLTIISKIQCRKSSIKQLEAYIEAVLSRLPF